MPALKKMVAVVDLGVGGNQTVYFMSNPLLYESITAEVGIALATAEASGDPQVVHRIEDLQLYGALETLLVRTGTTPLNRKTARILCAPQKAATAEKNLIRKTIPQGTIAAVSADLKAQNYL